MRTCGPGNGILQTIHTTPAQSNTTIDWTALEREPTISLLLCHNTVLPGGQKERPIRNADWPRGVASRALEQRRRSPLPGLAFLLRNIFHIVDVGSGLRQDVV